MVNNKTRGVTEGSLQLRSKVRCRSGTRGEGFRADEEPCAFVRLCVCVGCVCYLQLTWCTPECVRKAVGERRRDFTRLFEQEGKKLMKNRVQIKKAAICAAVRVQTPGSDSFKGLMTRE